MFQTPYCMLLNISMLLNRTLVRQLNQAEGYIYLICCQYLVKKKKKIAEDAMNSAQVKLLSCQGCISMFVVLHPTCPAFVHLVLNTAEA